jgi:hypothetical protein
LISVGSRISWGAIVAGALLTLAIYFLLSILGAAVGLSVSDRVSARNLQTGAVAWAVVTTCTALFMGGLTVSQFTVGENKTEAALYGIIMWALVLALLVAMGTAGANAGFNGMIGMANLAQEASTHGWEASARQAGVPADQIDEWRRKLSTTAADVDDGKEAPTVTRDDAKRITWYAFLGTWLSMIAAAAGALVGAGPAVRIVALRETASRVVTTT